MKKFLTFVLLLAGMLAGTQDVNAQKEVEKFGYFDHLSGGVTVGLGGIGFDLGTCVGEYIQLRAGAQFMPSFSYEDDFGPHEIREFHDAIVSLKSINVPGFTFVEPERVDVKAKLGFHSGKVLVDVFPFPKKSNFHVTAGFYFGGSDFIVLNNTNSGAFNSYCYPDYRNYPASVQSALLSSSQYDPTKAGQAMYGIRLGDYRLTPDENGNLQAGIHVNKFRPYLGVGFGRAVPRKRIGFMFEMGVQFWGTPQLYIEGGNGRHDVTEKDISDNGGNDGGLINTLHSISVYPMMTLRLCGRIF